jgi:hypothetical protein
VTVDGYSFPEAATVGGQNLVLNGVASSSILSTRSSIVAFYLASKQKTTEAATTLKGAKRIQFYMVRTVSARPVQRAARPHPPERQPRRVPRQHHCNGPARHGVQHHPPHQQG